MRSFTPQVETREIADSDLDNVSGGVSISGGASHFSISSGGAFEDLGEIVGTVASHLPTPHLAGGASL